MIECPKTLEEARKYKYNQWAGNPKGYRYKENLCAYEIYIGWFTYQCSRTNGHGPNDLYCKQHAKKVEDL